jgi:hypothetical protein
MRRRVSEHHLGPTKNRNVTAKKKKPEDGTSAPAPKAPKKKAAAPVAEAAPIVRRPEPKKPSKTIDWACLHLSVRSGYKWQRISHKYDPDTHAQLCQKMRDGTLGCGYYIQFDNPLAPPGSLLEVLHPHETYRVDFDTLDTFVSKATRSAPAEAGVQANGE